MKEERGKNWPNILRQESNLRPFTNRANALPTELRRQGLSKRQLSQLFLPLKDAEPLFPADPTAVAGSHPRRFPYHSMFSSLFFHIILHSPKSAFFIILLSDWPRPYLEWLINRSGWDPATTVGSAGSSGQHLSEGGRVGLTDVWIDLSP